MKRRAPPCEKIEAQPIRPATGASWTSTARYFGLVVGDGAARFARIGNGTTLTVERFLSRSEFRPRPETAASRVLVPNQIPE
jgi:hypothetical protein